MASLFQPHHQQSLSRNATSCHFAVSYLQLSLLSPYLCIFLPTMDPNNLCNNNNDNVGQPLTRRPALARDVKEPMGKAVHGKLLKRRILNYFWTEQLVQSFFPSILLV